MKHRSFTWKESVWQNHLFAVLYSLLPKTYRLDPEFGMKSPNNAEEARMDYRIHGNDYFGALEFYSTEFDSGESTTLEPQDYNEPYKNLVANGKGEIAVINVSHNQKPDCSIPGKKPNTYFDLIIHDNQETFELQFDKHHITLEKGKPILYDVKRRECKPFLLSRYLGR
jgi:hypothetical protein